MVAAGGSLPLYGAHRPAQGAHGAQEELKLRSSNPFGAQLMSSGVMALAVLALIAVAAIDSGNGAVELEQKGAVKTLAVANTLMPQEVQSGESAKATVEHAHNAMVTAHEESLQEAKMSAEKRLRVVQANRKMSAESKEEQRLRKQLDADVKGKEQAAFKNQLESKAMASVLKEAQAADKAKALKVKVINAKTQKSGNMAEEAALRKQLNEQVKMEQDKLLRKALPQMHIKGIKESAVSAAKHLASKKQLSESDLEAQLRAQLNAKVHNDEKGMFKRAVTKWLGKDLGVKAGAQSQTKAAKGGKGKGSSSLQAAERMMKMSMAHTNSGDTTLSHRSLNDIRHAKKSAHVSGLTALENAMIHDTLKEAKKDSAHMKGHKGMMDKLRQAADAKTKALASQSSKPSYKDAMLTFSKRLQSNEHAAEHKYDKNTMALRNQFNQASKKDLEAAIKQKVANKLETGNSQLQAARAKLMQEFSGPHSLFAKTEAAELKSLQKAQAKKQAQL